MSLLTVLHLTVYRYSKPVGLGVHRMMFRPRESHDLRLLEARLTIAPEPDGAFIFRWRVPRYHFFPYSICLGVLFQTETLPVC
jgi:Bacterial transglutaminase-like N-terminal region